MFDRAEMMNKAAVGIFKINVLQADTSVFREIGVVDEGTFHAGVILIIGNPDLAADLSCDVAINVADQTRGADFRPR